MDDSRLDGDCPQSRASRDGKEDETAEERGWWRKERRARRRVVYLRERGGGGVWILAVCALTTVDRVEGRDPGLNACRFICKSTLAGGHRLLLLAALLSANTPPSFSPHQSYHAKSGVHTLMVVKMITLSVLAIL